MALAVPALRSLGVAELLVLCLGLLTPWPATFGAGTSAPAGDEGTPPSSSPAQLKNDAIVRLSKVFELDKLPVQRHHRSPPQYMVDLYNTVAFGESGITKTSSPYGSDIVRGFPDRDTTHRMHFFYNVSYIKDTEKVLEAEFHLFKLKPRPPEPGSRVPRGVHLIEVKLYQVLDQTNMYSPEGVKLLHFRRISIHKFGWEVFRINNTVKQWVNDSASNQGFLVTATVGGGGGSVRDRAVHVNGSYVRFAQRSEHHDSKQPVLVVFTESQKKPDLYDDTLDPDILGSQAERRPVSRSYAKFLNEQHRAHHGAKFRVYPFRPTYRSSYQPSPDVPQEDEQTSSRARRSHSRSKRSVDYYNFPRKRKQTCSKHELYVDFDEIGWSGWIISPKGYNAYHCKGECPFPLGQNQKPTNHATVQSIVHALRIGKAVGTPCCVPNKLYSISLLYFDDDENVILKQYDDMVAASCGCH